MATGGDLLFQGGSDKGVFRAIDARTGNVVWTFRTGSNFRNSPITYRAFDVTACRKAFPTFAFTALEDGLSLAQRDITA